MSTEYSKIAVQREGRVVRLTLNRPGKLNALDPTMLDELLDVLAVLDADDEVNALLLTGSGRLFCAGVDLSTPFFMEQVTDESIFSGKRLLDRQHRLIEALYRLPFLTVAAVNGDAVGGGGFGMAMSCDLRIAVRAAKFWMIPSKLDVVQDFGLSWLVQQQVGPSRTLQMAVLGQPVDAATAADWGLVNELVEDESGLQERISELTGELNTMGTEALRMLKHIVRNGANSQLHEQLRTEAIANGLTFHSAEFAERKADYLARLHGRTS